MYYNPWLSGGFLNLPLPIFSSQEKNKAKFFSGVKWMSLVIQVAGHEGESKNFISTWSVHAQYRQDHGDTLPIQQGMGIKYIEFSKYCVWCDKASFHTGCQNGIKLSSKKSFPWNLSSSLSWVTTCLESHAFFLFVLFSFWWNKFSNRKMFLTNNLLNLNFLKTLTWEHIFLHILMLVWLTTEF